MCDLRILGLEEDTHGIKLHGELVDGILFRILSVVTGMNVLSIGQSRDEQDMPLGVGEQFQLPRCTRESRADGVGHVEIVRHLGGKLKPTKKLHLHGLGRTTHKINFFRYNFSPWMSSWMV